jgi:orotidine-5'-phosphate decarboxylase
MLETEGPHLPTSFASRLEQAFSKYGQLCVGIDPHASLLEEWGLDDSVEGLRTFSQSVLESSVGRVGIVKPQVAFFERFGSRGFSVLEEFANNAAETDILVIMDAKRGDIGSTMTGYFDAWLGKEAPFICDALTVNPFLGVGSLAEVMSDSLERGKGLFLLAATSNGEGKSVQRARVGEATLSADILRQLDEINAVNVGSGDRLGSFGAVVGATQNLAASGIASLQTDAKSRTPILAPGFGAQGANLDELSDLFQVASNRVVASVSRSVLSAGAKGLAAAIDGANLQLRAGFLSE